MRFIQDKNIELTPEETSSLVSGLATALEVPQQQLTLLSVWSPSFFRDRTCIFRATALVPGKQSPAYLGCYSRDDGEVAVLKRTDISGVNSFLDYIARHPDRLILDRDTVPDYVAFFLGVWGNIHGHILVETPSDVCWHTDLMEEEQNRISAALEACPLEVHTDGTNGRFEVSACVLEEDKLKRITFFVENGYRSTQAPAGDLNLSDENEQVLLTSLPDNYTIPADSWAAMFADDTATSQNCGWITVSDDDEKYALLQDVFRNLEPVPAPEYCSVRRKYLPFYRQFLYQISCPYDGLEHVADVVWSPGDIQLIHHDNASIQRLYERYSDALHSELGNELSVREYVRFLGEYRWDEDGPSLTVEDSRHPRFADVDIESMTPRPGLSVEEAWNRIRPIQARRDDNSWLVSTCQWKGYEIIEFTMRVMANGDIEVTDAEMLMSFPAHESYSTHPYLRMPLALNSLSTWQQQKSQEALVPCDAASLAEHIVSALDKGMLVISNRVIFGNLDLEGVSLGGGLCFRNCRFRGHANLASIDSASNLNITACVFENGLTLTHANINHVLSISDTVFLAGKSTARSLEMLSLSAQSVEIVRTSCQRGLQANGLSIRDDVRISDYTAYGVLSMRESAIGGVLTLASEHRPFYVHAWADIEYIKARSVFVQGVTIHDALDMTYGDVEQYIAFEASENEHDQWPVRIGHWDDDGTSSGLSLYGTVIKHNFLAFRGIDIAGELNATYVRVGTGIFVAAPQTPGMGNHIGGTFLLNGAIAPQALKISGCRIGGNLHAPGARIGEVKIRETVIIDDDRPDVCHEPVEVGGNIEFPDAVIDGDACFIGITTNTIDTDTPHSLVLRRITVKGNLTLYEHAEHSEARTSAATLPRGINLSKASIGGDLDLSHVIAPEGQLDLSDALVKQDLCMTFGPLDPPAKIAMLNMTGMQCGGNIDLSGLTLVSGPLPVEIPGQSSILAQGITVDGALNIYNAGASALIPGRLDLSSSKLGELSISYKYFKSPCDNESLEKRGILLNKASVEKLSVTVDDGFPCPIDLRFAEIKWWEFHRSGNTSCENADDYIALLAKDPNKQRHTWRAVENSLYERGYEDAADSVHKAMRSWVRETEKQAARASGSVFRKIWFHIRSLPHLPLDFFTEYGTTTWRLVIVMLLWFSLSVYLFSINDNIAPSEEALAATNTSLTNNQHPTGWGIWDGFWVAIRFHVPVVLFTARDEWEPTNGNRLVVYKDAANSGQVYFPVGDPEEYANLVIILHWLAWPIILITASRKLFRRPGGS